MSPFPEPVAVLESAPRGFATVSEDGTSDQLAPKQLRRGPTIFAKIPVAISPAIPQPDPRVDGFFEKESDSEPG